MLFKDVTNEDQTRAGRTHGSSGRISRSSSRQKRESLQTKRNHLRFHAHHPGQSNRSQISGYGLGDRDACYGNCASCGRRPAVSSDLHSRDSSQRGSSIERLIEIHRIDHSMSGVCSGVSRRHITRSGGAPAYAPDQGERLRDAHCL